MGWKIKGEFFKVRALNAMRFNVNKYTISVFILWSNICFQALVFKWEKGKGQLMLESSILRKKRHSYFCVA